MFVIAAEGLAWTIGGGIIYVASYVPSLPSLSCIKATSSESIILLFNYVKVRNHSNTGRWNIYLNAKILLRTSPLVGHLLIKQDV